MVAENSKKTTSKKPLIQPDKADFIPEKIVNGRPLVKSIDASSVEELLDRRAKAYDSLLNLDFANEKPGSGGASGFNTFARATVRNVDEELVKRGEDVSKLPQPSPYDPDYIPGSGKRAPYLRSTDEVSNVTNTPKRLKGSALPTGASGVADENARLAASSSKIVFHGSPESGLKIINPSKSVSETSEVPKVWTFDADRSTAENAAEKLRPYTIPRNTHGALVPDGQPTGSIYIGEADDLVNAKAPVSPIASTEKPVRVLEEISLAGKSQEQINQEINQAMERVKSLRPIAAAEVDNLSAAVISAAPTPPAAPAAATIASAVVSAPPVSPAAAVAAVAASAAVTTGAAPVPPLAPVAAVADAVVSSGASGATAAGSAVAAATATSSKIVNVGKKITMNPKTKIAAAVAVAGGIIGFRYCQKNQ